MTASSFRAPSAATAWSKMRGEGLSQPTSPETTNASHGTQAVRALLLPRRVRVDDGPEGVDEDGADGQRQRILALPYGDSPSWTDWEHGRDGTILYRPCRSSSSVPFVFPVMAGQR